MEIKNWILKKHFKNIKVVSETYLPFYKDFLSNKAVIINEDFSKSQSFINWKSYVALYEFFYDYDGCEREVEKQIMDSELTNSKSIFMDFGYNNPVVEIDVKYFINNWYDLINGAHFESTIVSNDGKYIMEFIKGGILRSNFKIK